MRSCSLILCAAVLFSVGLLCKAENKQETHSQSKADVVFNDADIRSALSSLAEIAKRNLVLHPSVQGRISIKLSNVSPVEAMRIIALTNGFYLSDKENVLHVAPLGS